MSDDGAKVKVCTEHIDDIAESGQPFTIHFSK